MSLIEAIEPEDLNDSRNLHVKINRFCCQSFVVSALCCTLPEDVNRYKSMVCVVGRVFAKQIRLDTEQEESDVLTAILPVLNKSDNYSRKPILFRPANGAIPRYDLRVSVPPRHVLLLMGGEVFCRQDAPLV